MKNFKRQGLIISLEGIEGSGKSTQIAKLTDYFEQKGYSVLSLREPGGTDTGEKIRNVLLNLPKETYPLTEALLFAASRAELLTHKILPFIQDKKSVVLLDRYIDSSYAYQAYAGKLGEDAIKAIHSIDPLTIMPDITFYYKISLKTSMERQSKRGQKKDYFESKPDSFYEKLIKGFDERAQNFSERIFIINGEQDSESVFQDSVKNIRL